MPGVGQQQHRRAVGQRGHQPGQPRLLHRLVEGHDPAGEGDAEVGGQPVQPAGVLDGQHVGGRHHLAQPRADVARAARGAHHPAPAVPSRTRACHGRTPAPVHLPWRHGGAGTRAGGARSRTAPSRTPARRRPPPRPRRDRTPPLPDDRAAVLAAHRGARAWSPWSAGCGASPTRATCSSTRPTTRPRPHELLTWGFEYNRGYSFIVHPPLGKWLIAAGEQLFGYNSLGWRFPSRGGRHDRRRRPRPAGPAADRLDAARAARRPAARPRRRSPSRSRGSACSTSSCRCSSSPPSPAWSSTATGCARGSARRPTSAADGFRLGPRGWRIAAGVLFGCACAVKWSGVWFLAFFAVLSLFWDRAAWREAGVARPTRVAAAPRPARRGVGARRRPGADLPRDASPAGSSARPRRARPGRSRTPTPRSRSSPTRCARCGTSTPSG